MDKGTLMWSLPLAEMQGLNSQVADTAGVYTSCLPAQLGWEIVTGYSQCCQEQPSISSGLAIWRSASNSKSSAAKRELKTHERNWEPQLSKFLLKVTGKSLFQQIRKQNKHSAKVVLKRLLPNSWKEIWHEKRGRELQKCKTALAWQ